MEKSRLLKLLSGPLAAAIVWAFFELDPANPLTTRMAGIIAWITIWWLTEALELGVTALLPLVLMPLLGIADMKTTSMQYMDQVIFLFIGGFMLAIAMEKWNLHKRIALNILLRVGSKPSQILFGVMLSSFLMSMWISNTATVMMLFPAVVSIAAGIKTGDTGYEKFAAGMMIGLAYSATIGGMCTLVGTPTNMIFASFYSREFPSTEISFANWLLFAMPLAALFFVFTFFVLKFLFIRNFKLTGFSKIDLVQQLKSLGAINREEKIVLAVFFSAAVLWFFRSRIDVGFMEIKGWSEFFGKPTYLQDSTVAICMALLLFLIPSKEKNAAILEWKDAKRIPFNIVFLFGGGFAIAMGFEASGLSNWLAEVLSSFRGADMLVVIMVVCCVITLLSEFASNVATIQLMLPVLVSMSVSLDIPALTLMIPATLAASSGFMLPVATAPNTIVYSSGLIPQRYMLKAGVILDICFIILIVCAFMVFSF